MGELHPHEQDSTLYKRVFRCQVGPVYLQPYKNAPRIHQECPRNRDRYLQTIKLAVTLALHVWAQRTAAIISIWKSPNIKYLVIVVQMDWNKRDRIVTASSHHAYIFFDILWGLVPGTPWIPNSNDVQISCKMSDRLHKKLYSFSILLYPLKVWF